jgi:hypothetical protein
VHEYSSTRSSLLAAQPPAYKPGTNFTYIFLLAMYFLVRIVISSGFREKEALQRLAEW